jgi:RNA polymerase sigma factor (sigma-70 family)
VDENGLDRVISGQRTSETCERGVVEENSVNEEVVRDLQTLFGIGVMGALSDGQLLDRFVERREGAVFEAIVCRHGPMVWGVCRRVLRDHHDAEDAFQATFLILARKAASIMPREKLGNWLYGVAYRTAMKARTKRTKRRGREGQAPNMPEPMSVPDDLRDELAESLDRELSRLPEKYRIPIVLCDLEGGTHKEAASQLGWPIGTVSSRLSRARSKLARRLSRRGVSLSSGSMAVLLTADSASADALTKLIGPTSRAASLVAAGRAATTGIVSAEVAALAEGVIKAMMLSKLKVVTAVLAVCLALVAGGTGLAQRAQAPGKKAGGAARGAEAGPRKPRNQGRRQALPGKAQSNFGGGPGEPLYMRKGDLFFVRSAVGDRFSIYDAATKRASSLRLPGSKESPLGVVPIIGDELISLRLDGQRITRLYVFSVKDWKWYPQDLKEPGPGGVAAHMGRSVASYAQGRYVYAFSAKAKRWSVLELPPEALPRPNMSAGQAMSIGMDAVVIEYDGHVHEFSGETGEWTHTDLRAVIDAAIDSAEDETKPDAKTKN